ncbi:SNF2-related protein [Vibrio scophthalmi]|uniref:Defense against restriction protein B n=3 Tax=Vibrio scophthalmi TaxID=45658 RepID=A0A1C7FJL6_9VIBR|nr:SNF2-related protein [Vibrio scophthalmi]ANU39504.1 Defense against restriction protein B [Vibrio scophthalmi]
MREHIKGVNWTVNGWRNRLAFMPSVAQADRALDMQIKNNYLKRKNSGRGVYMLTATPAVNSPVDAFNMLSHVVPPDTFARMGITDGDDFIRLFGRTGETAVHKLSGDVETKEALLGFQNLGALRKLFHRYVTVKDIKDVDSEVHIPELEKQTNYVDMSEEQEEIYEELRARAEALSNPDSDEAKEIAEEFPDDSVFAIIRQMDKACTDLDLYNGVVTYRFPKSKELAVRELVESVPTEITVKRSVYDEKAGKFKQKNIAINGNIDISIDGKHVVIVATQELDNVITEAAAKANLSFSHPVAPKYAKFLDNAKKAYLAGGKQLVFTEEKTQHVKLARIISQHVGCDISEIGIINSDTVAGKKGSKVDDSLEEAGLEAIAKEYNSGRYKFVILNKKGEVGINLHHGTTDIHHLTLPFTPASLTQRNGRGARVGSKEATVKVHYYAGKGSFDKFRISKIEQKASWLGDLFNGEEPSLENGDAADTNETAIMLAADPEEAKRRQEAAQIEQEKKLKQEKQRRASIAASRYLQAVDALKENREQLESEFSILNDKVKKQEELVALHQQDYKADKKSRYYRDRFNSTKKDLFRLRENRLAVSKKIERIGGAESAKKRFMPDVEKAIKDGALSEYGDILAAPENYLALNGKVIRNGFTYVVKTPARMWDEKGEYVENTGTVVELDAQGERALCLMLTDNGSASKNNTSWVNIERFIRLADVNQSEQQLISKARAGIKLSDIAHTLSLEQFYQLIEQGDLTRYYNTRGGVAVDNAGKLIHVYEFKDPEYTMLYPDLSDAGMINRLLDAAVKDIESKGRSSLENIMTDYVGIDWLTMVHDRGQSATDEVIQSRVQALFSESEGLFKDKYEEALIGYSQPYESEVQKKVNNIDWEGFVNRGVIRTACTNALSIYMAAIKEKAVENIEKGQLEAFAAYKALCESDPTRQERLENIADLMRKYKREHDFRSHCDELYPKEDNLAAITAFADITAIGRKEPLTSGSLLFTTANFPNTKTNAFWEWSSIFRSFKSSFLQHMDEIAEQNKAIVETVPVTELQKEKIDNLTLVPIDFATMESELKDTGVMVKLNSESMVHQFKRRKTNMPAFGYIGLFDVNGRNGALGRTFAGRANSDNKERFKALYSADISSEFTGSWWFVPATIDIAALTELLKDEA